MPVHSYPTDCSKAQNKPRKSQCKHARASRRPKCALRDPLFCFRGSEGRFFARFRRLKFCLPRNFVLSSLKLTTMQIGLIRLFDKGAISR